MTDTIQVGDTVEVIDAKSATAVRGKRPKWWGGTVNGAVGKVVDIEYQSWGLVYWVKLLSGVTTAFGKADIRKLDV